MPDEERVMGATTPEDRFMTADEDGLAPQTPEPTREAPKIRLRGLVRLPPSSLDGPLGPDEREGRGETVSVRCSPS